MGSSDGVADPKPREGLTPLRRALFSLGTLGSAGPGVTMVQLQPYFSRLGYSASIIGNVRFFSLVFDAITDPLMGYISDHTSSRSGFGPVRGRRLPYIAVGSFLFAAGLIGMWFAPAGLTTAQFYAYLIAMQIVFTIGVTMTGVPYQALIPELAKEYSARTTLVSWMQAGTYLGSLWGGGVRAYANWRGDEITGFREFAIYCSLMMIVCYWLLVLFLKEPELTEEQQAALRERQARLRGHVLRHFTDLGRSMAFALKDWRFLVLFLTTFTYQAGVLAGIWMYPYILTDWFGTWDTPYAIQHIPALFREPYFLWIFFGITCGVIYLPFWNWLGKHWEKRTCLLIGIIGVGCAYGISYFMFAPQSFPLLIVYCLLLGFVYCPANIYPVSMIADIATHNEYQTGEANEGMFYGAWSFLVKAYNGFAVLWTGFALDHIVKYQPGEDVVQTADTLHRMRVLYAAPPLIMAFLAVFILLRYDLTRARMAGVTAQLEARRRESGQESG
jgi:glycoside/pentoside/hexuronide:cation symporter, GPH family